MTLLIESLELTLSNRTVVKDLTLNVDPGEVVGLLGPNGAGKTSTFNMIVGFTKPNKGNIFLEGKCIKNYSMTKRVQLGIGYLAQEPSAFRSLTVRENLDIALFHSGLSQSLCRKKRETLIDKFNLCSFIDRYGYQLSGGERRRCEVARALAVGRTGPKYLLLDEPFAGIDPIAIEEVKSTIDLLKKINIGIIITDHNVKEALSIVDFGYIIYNGEIIKSGNPKEITSDKFVKKIYLGNTYQ